MNEGLDAVEVVKPAISPDGLMRVETKFKVVKVLSIPDGKLLHQFQTPGLARTPTFSPDSKTLVFEECQGNLGCAGTLRAWNLETNKSRSLGTCSGIVTRMNFSADGTRLTALTSYSFIVAIVVGDKNKAKRAAGEFLVIDVDSATQLLKQKWLVAKYVRPTKSKDAAAAYYNASFKSMPKHVSLNSDGSKLLVATPDGITKIYDVQSGKLSVSINTKTFQFHEERKRDPR